jgi:hypothetical protein
MSQQQFLLVGRRRGRFVWLTKWIIDMRKGRFGGLSCIEKWIGESGGFV